MNDRNHPPSLVSRSLPLRQQQYIVDFLTPNARQYRQLVSPTGGGKIRMCAALISELFAKHDVSHVLVVVDRDVLQEQFVKVLSPSNLPVPIVAVDRRLFRQLDAAVEGDTSPWIKPVVAVMNSRVIMQHEVATSLTTVTWDLVIIAMVVGQHPEIVSLIDGLRASQNVSRLLVMTSVQDASLAGQGFETTLWDRDETESDLSILKGKIKFQVVDYERSAEEVRFLRAVQGLAQELGDGEAEKLMKAVWLRSASSSIYAIEQTLRGQRNLLAHGVLPLFARRNESGDDLSGDELWFPSQSPDGSRKGDAAPTWAKLFSVIDLLEDVRIDAKLQALLNLLEVVGVSGMMKHIVIFTAFARTATYVYSAIHESKSSTFLLTSSKNIDEVTNLLTEFRENGGILVATTASLEGVELSYVGAVVNYDLSADPAELYARLSRLRETTSSNSITIFNFRDKSNVMAEELQTQELAVKLLSSLATSNESRDSTAD